jgi:hypothetical protein
MNGLIGAIPHKVYDPKKGWRKQTSNEYKTNILTGVMGGGIAGGYMGQSIARASAFNKVISKGRAAGVKTFGRSYHNFHNNDENFREEFKKKFSNQSHWNSGTGGSGGGGAGFARHRDVGSIHKDLGTPKGGFKTKAEATKHYRGLAAKHHPDRGGKTEDMQRINAAWDEFKKHPDGFEKLAGLGILSWIYS